MKKRDPKQKCLRANLTIFITLTLCAAFVFAAATVKVLSGGAQSKDSAAVRPTPERRAKAQKNNTAGTNNGSAPQKISPASGANGDLVFGRGYAGFGQIIRRDLTATPNETQLSCCGERDADWSPDGARVAFTSGRDRGDNGASTGELYIMNADGTNQRRLTFYPAQYSLEKPKFSPDGTKIVYTVHDGNDNEIEILNLADLSVSVVTVTDENENAPDWSPDGSRIIFTRYDDGSGNDNIYTIETGGANETLLLDALDSLASPSYSPDGSKIVYSRDESGGENIYVANADGTGMPLRVSSNAAGTDDEEPSWSPDGTKIVFTSFRGGNSRIFTVNADGSEETEIVSHEYEFFSSPSWQSVCGAPIISDGLLAWWRGEGNAADSAGTNNGAEFGGTTYQTGRIGQAFEFDGADDFIEVPDDDGLDVQTGDFTLAAWVQIRAANSDTHYIAGKGALGDVNSSFHIGVSALNRPYFQIWNEDGTQGVIGESGEPLALNQWHHVIMRKQGGNIKLFVDGVEKASESPGFNYVANTAPFTIGKGDFAPSPSPTLTLNGLADEVHLYSRALSNAEVETLYNGSNPPCPTTPQIRLRYNGVNPVSAGRQASMTLYLPEFAPAGGATVDLAVVGEAGAVTIPSSVVVPEGAYETSFTIETAVTNQNKSVDITATHQTSSGRATVSIHPAVADLTVSNLVAPAEVEILQNFTASWTTANVGQAVTNQNDWTDCVYISPDSEYNNGNDTQIGCFYHNSVLNAGESRPTSINHAYIPGAAIPTDGDYYLFVFTNGNFRVNEREAFFTNNFTSRQIRVLRRLPDYVAQNVAAPATIEPGVNFQVSFTTRNQGSRAATVQTQNHVYYSTDNVAGNADDYLLAVTVSPALGIDATHDNSISATIPTLPVRPSTDAFVYVKTDALNNVYESESGQPAEQNNATFRAARFEYRVPDLQVTSITPPPEPETDTEFALAWTTRNNGARAAGFFNDVVFFSTDNQVGNDVVIGNFILNNLAADTSVNRVQNVTIPTSAIPATGDYFIYVVTDHQGYIDEGANENNNIRFQPVRVRRFQRPDLQVTAVAAPAAAFFDQTIQVQWTVTNNGPGATNSNLWYDAVYLSSTQNPSNQMIQPTNVNSLLVGESYITSATFRLPRGISGTYYIVVKTDNANQVNEESESNNVASRAITINVPPVPDLRVSNVQAPAEGFAGQNIAVNWTVTNVGTGATLPGETTWTDAVFVSQDATLDANDPRIGLRQRTGALAANESYAVTGFAATLPGNIIGDYYVFVVSDVYGQLYEFNAENNNSDYDRLQPGSPMNVIAAPPDLVILAPFGAPATGNADSVINVSFTVKNQGAFSAGDYWYEGVYLSSDQTLSADDIFIGHSPVRNGLTAGSQYNAAFGVRLPACLSGTYYIIAKTDFNNRVFEYDPGFEAENNNASQPRQIQITNVAPDLRVTGVNTPPVAAAGQALSLQWTVQNFGGSAPQNTWFDRVLLYAEENQPPLLLGTFERTAGNLVPGGSYTQNQVVILPAYLNGNYRLTVQTDTYNSVSECGFESNNENLSPQFAVANSLPDLQIPNVVQVPTAVLGTSVNVEFTGANSGAAMTQPATWIDRVYLSSDDVYNDGYDTPVGSQLRTAQLGTGETYSGQIAATMPNVQPGNYFLIVRADGGGNLTEGSPTSQSETNNWRAVPIALTAPGVDLQISNVAADATLYSGLVTNVSWRVTNAGNQPTLTHYWTDYVILSRDSVFDPADRILGYKTRNAGLAGGASYDETHQVFIPGGLTGEYNLFVFTDYGNSVIENNDANNLSAPRAATLELPLPADLNITNITPPASAAPGENAIFTWTVQNSGPNAASGLWQDTLYLSLDDVWDSSDAIVGSQTRLGPVAPAATYTANLTVAIPPIETGTYYVIVRTDARNAVRETDEVNNLSTSIASTNVAVTTLALGVPHPTTLVTNQERFYKYETPADETLLVTLTGETGSRNELFTRFGSIVNRSNYEIQSVRQGEPNQENVVGSTRAGTYYSMIRGDYVPNSFAENLKESKRKKDARAETAPPQNVTVKAELIPFSVRRVSPTVAGNKGLATLLIEGARFQTGATVKLVGAAGAEILPTTTEVGVARIAAIFDLSEKPAGNYSVVVTNPNKQTATLAGGFEIKNGGGHRLRSTILGPLEARGGSVGTRYTIYAANDGLNDAMYVPILVQFPAHFAYTLDRRNFIDLPASELPPDADPAQIPLDTTKDGLRTLMLFAPILRANSSVHVSIDIMIPPLFSDFKVQSVVLPPLVEFAAVFDAAPANRIAGPVYGPALAPAATTSAECFYELFRQAFFAATQFLFLNAEACLKLAWTIAHSSVDLISNIALKAATGNVDSVSAPFDAIGALSSKFISTAAAALECAGNAILWIKMAAIAVTLGQLFYQLYDCLKNARDEIRVSRPASLDPNEKIGPEGYGAERFVGVQKPLFYRINFENLAAATAPAQRISIVDELPAGLDARTVRLVEIGFKQNRYVVPENQAFYQNRVQLGADLNDLKADIFAGLDIVNNRVTWTLTAIDPATGEQPLSPLVGLLPPNNAERDGEGYVTFTVLPSAASPTRTVLENRATIYFDDNEPIVTNAVSNLLDADLPTSQCAPLPATQTSPIFTIECAGSDAANGSGFESYDIWVSENGGAYFPALTGLTAASAQFTGKWGRSYSFYSVARDHSGNFEAPPETPDATTAVLGGAFEADVAPRPNGNNGGTLSTADVIQIRRFLAGLDQPYQYNEFQRADCAPLAARGGGTISTADVIQARRFLAGLDPLPEAEGPLTSNLIENALSSVAGFKTQNSKPNVAPNELRATRVSRTGNKLVVAVEFDSQGDAVGIGFSLNFETSVLSNPVAALGSGASGSTLTVNVTQLAQGRFGIALDRDPAQPLPSGTRQLVTVEFDVVPTSPPPSTTIGFGNLPIEREVILSNNTVVVPVTSSAQISLAPATASAVSVSGRVATAQGRGISKVMVTLTDQTGAQRVVLTNPQGFYRFNGIGAGQTCIITVGHKRFQFEPPTRTVSVAEDLTDVDFTARE